MLSVTTITFGLRVLQGLGFSASLVFSPILLLLAANNQKSARKTFNFSDRQLTRLVENSQRGFETEHDMNLIVS